MEIAVKIVGVLHILIALAIIAVVLMQQAKKPGMSGVLGGNLDNSYYGRNKGRTRDGVLMKITAACAVVFLCTSLFLAYNFALTNPTSDTDTAGTTDTTGIDVGDTLPIDENGNVTVPAQDTAGETEATAQDGTADGQEPANEAPQAPAE